MRGKAQLDKLLWGREKRGPIGETLRVVAMCVWKFNRDRGPLRASALAFSTALGLVPLLALAFAIVKGIGAEATVIKSVIEHLVPGNMQVADKIMEYAGRIKVSTLGLAGFGSFLLTALLVLNNVEHCFNDVWGVARGRSFMRKVTDYSAIMIVCPLLLILSTSMATTAQVSRYLWAIELVEKTVPLIFSFGPFIAKAIAFAAAYIVIPNHRVGLRSAVIGGLAAAIFWTLAEGWYIRVGIGMVKTNAVYGALAHLPAFLVWVYVGWCIVIIGAELTCVLELEGRGRYLKGGEELRAPRLTVAMKLLAKAASSYAEGKSVTGDELIAQTGLHPVEGRRILGELISAGLLAQTDADQSRILPALSPETTPMSEIAIKVMALGDEGGRADRIEEKLYADIRKAYGNLTWSEWLASTR